MLQPNDELVLTLTVTETNQLLDVLQGGAYRIVAPIIGKILQQAQAQQQQEAMEGNGLAQAIKYAKGEQSEQTVTE